jgi:hypothetical protein
MPCVESSRPATHQSRQPTPMISRSNSPNPLDFGPDVLDENFEEMTQITMDADFVRASWDVALTEEDQMILSAIPEGSMLSAPDAVTAGALARITKTWFTKIPSSLEFLRTYHREIYRELKDTINPAQEIQGIRIFLEAPAQSSCEDIADNINHLLQAHLGEDLANIQSDIGSIKRVTFDHEDQTLRFNVALDTLNRQMRDVIPGLLSSVNDNVNAQTKHWAEKTFNVVRNNVGPAPDKPSAPTFAAVAAGPLDQPSKVQKLHNGIKGLQSTLSKVLSRLSTLENLPSSSNAPNAVTNKRKASEEPEENPGPVKKTKTDNPAPTTPDNIRYSIGIKPDFKRVVGNNYDVVDLVDNFKTIIQRHPQFRESNLHMITVIGLSGTGNMVVSFKHTKDAQFIAAAVTIVTRRIKESFPGSTTGASRKITPWSKIRVMNVRYYSLLQDPKLSGLGHFQTLNYPNTDNYISMYYFGLWKTTQKGRLPNSDMMRRV